MSEWQQVQRRMDVRSQFVKWEDSLFVFVENMAENTLVEWLRSSFSLFGKVVDGFVHQFGRKGQGRCFGFVRFRERRLP